jgi:hypothetical protein
VTISDDAENASGCDLLNASIVSSMESNWEIVVEGIVSEERTAVRKLPLVRAGQNGMGSRSLNWGICAG